MSHFSQFCHSACISIHDSLCLSCIHPLHGLSTRSPHQPAILWLSTAHASSLSTIHLHNSHPPVHSLRRPFAYPMNHPPTHSIIQPFISAFHPSTLSGIYMLPSDTSSCTSPLSDMHPSTLLGTTYPFYQPFTYLHCQTPTHPLPQPFTHPLYDPLHCLSLYIFSLSHALTHSAIHPFYH